MTKVNLNELYHTLHRLNRLMHRNAHKEGHGKGWLFHGQASLLLLLLQNDGVSQRELAEQLDIRPSSMTEMISKLDQSGLIEKKQDEKDQRVMRIYLTESGKKAAEGIIESKDELAEAFFSPLTEDEQEQLLMLTQKLCAGLESEASSDSLMHHCHGMCHHGKHHHLTEDDVKMHHKHCHNNHMHNKYHINNKA